KEFYKGISFEIESNIKTIRFKDEVEFSILRVAQESINNALKHSKATKIKVTLKKIDDTLIMVIEDNGIGFKNKNAKNNGIGLTNMKHRIEAIDGRISVNSIKGKGSSISV